MKSASRSSVSETLTLISKISNPPNDLLGGLLILLYNYFMEIEDAEYMAVDESEGLVFFFETKAKLRDWNNFGEKTYFASRPIEPEDLEY